MNKKFFWVIFLLFTFVVCGCSSTVVPEVKIFEEKYPTYLNESVGYVVAFDRTGKVKTGYSSAFIYDESSTHSFVITSNSIVKENYIYKFYVGNTIIDCNYIGSDNYLNVSVLSFETMANKVNKVDSGKADNLLVGNSIYIPILGSYASHLNNQVSLSKGIVSSLSSTYCGSDYLYSCNNYIISDAVSVETAKGAPVLDYYGNLVGVVSLIKYGEDNDALSYIVPESILEESIETILKSKKQTKADLHMDLVTYDKLSAEEKENVLLSDVEYSDLIIRDVTGYTESVAVPVYSRLVSLDEIEIKSLNHLVDVLYDYKQGDVVTIGVQIESGSIIKINIKL